MRLNLYIFILPSESFCFKNEKELFDNLLNSAIGFYEKINEKISGLFIHIFLAPILFSKNVAIIFALLFLDTMSQINKCISK